MMKIKWTAGFSILLFFATSLAAQSSQAAMQDVLKALSGTALFEV